jgi:uncharacterized protein
MTSLAPLLELQSRDTTIDQLRHRLRTLPERARLEELTRERIAVLDGVAEVQAQRDTLARDQKRLEDEVAGVEEKATSVDRQLYGGGVTSPKEAQALQADVESLKRRQATLEDQVLELMEAIEPLDEQIATADAAVAVIDGRTTEVADALAVAEAEVSTELARVEEERASLAADIDPELVSRYEAMRPQFDGVVIARLQGSTCQGCHLTLANAEVDRLRHEPSDAVVHCPECMRILVR